MLSRYKERDDDIDEGKLGRIAAVVLYIEVSSSWLCCRVATSRICVAGRGTDDGRKNERGPLFLLTRNSTN